MRRRGAVTFSASQALKNALQTVAARDDNPPRKQPSGRTTIGNCSGPYRKPIERTNQGDWIFGLVEASLFGNLMVFGQNMFNIGSTKLNYYNVGVTYNLGAHRIQVAYGRTRAGYNCSDGVCRYVPAFKELQVSWLFSNKKNS